MDRQGVLCKVSRGVQANERKFVGELLAEFIGTFILLFLGAGCVAAVILTKSTSSFYELSIPWGMAVAFAIYVCGGVSGCHINPAVTLALAVFRGFPWRKVPLYILAQTAGAFSGAAVVYSLYFNALKRFETSPSLTTAKIFSTYPQPYLSNFEAMWIEIIITALLVLVIFACTDSRNTAAPKGGHGALIIGLTVAIIGATFGPLTGFAMNPARDFGPKLFTALAGWGKIGLPGPNNYFWVPIVGPLLGGLLGGAVYEYCIGRFLRCERNGTEQA